MWGRATMNIGTAIGSALRQIFPDRMSIATGIVWSALILAWQIGHAVGWL